MPEPPLERSVSGNLDYHEEVATEYDRARRPLYSDGTGTCRIVNRGLCIETTDGELVKYDAKRLGSAAALAQIQGTVLASTSLWLHVGLYVLMATSVGVAVELCSERPELISGEKIREVVNYMSLFVAVTLALYVAVVIERWWEMRNTMLGGLWCAVDDLTMVLAVHFPRREHRRFKTLILRYCLLSVELMFMEAQGSEVDMGELCRRHLLRTDEREKLEKLASKPQVVWVWIAGTLQRLAEAGKLPSRLLVSLYGICAKARGALGGVSAHLDTQLPFTYVHLLSVVVHVNNLLVALKCGVLSAIAIWNLRRPETRKSPISDAENLQVLLLQIFCVVGIPFFNLGLLEVGVLVGNPLSNKFQDFPRSAFHMWMRDECEALQTTAEEAPAEISRVTEKVKFKDQSLVQDCVVVV
mmetsp:Transcript_127118/g.220320  ORF Transcript_127118/g.220320 Transcript_127118/m.220320 type:complete len:413 (+) Transcript_127118:53-1291(+)